MPEIISDTLQKPVQQPAEESTLPRMQMNACTVTSLNSNTHIHTHAQANEQQAYRVFKFQGDICNEERLIWI